MKKALVFALIFTMLISTLGIISYGSSFGIGIEVMTEECNVIKTGLFGQKIKFSDMDFKSAFAVTDFKSLTIISLPSTQEGTLLYGGRRVKEGQEIKRKNIAALAFIPASGEVKEASFEFKIDNLLGGASCKCRMKFIDKINYAPEAPEESAASLTLSTQEGISAYGRMRASDPEGDAIEYMVVTYPKNGILKTEKNGSYKYTPIGDFTGYDEFVYVARDEYGNYSRATTVSIKTTGRMSSVVYKDMTERSEYNAAVAMSALGIMSGSIVGDDSYFMPEETVSRAEFVAMAMKSYGIKADSTVTKTFFDDNDTIPTALVGYVATAQRLGIVDGSLGEGGLVFEPNRAVTKYEASQIMARILGIYSTSEECVFNDIETVPVWARNDVYAMYTLGIFETEDGNVNGSLHLTRADTAECLYRMMSIN